MASEITRTSKTAFYQRPVAFPLVMLTAYVVLAVVGLYGLIIAGMDSGSANIWASVIMDIVIGSACAVALYKIYGRNFLMGENSGEEDGDNGKARFLLVSIVVFAFAWSAGQLAALGYTVLLGQGDPDNIRFAAFDTSLPYLALSIVAAPIAEELLFRGVLYKRLSSTRIPSLLVALMVSIVFAIFHGADLYKFFETFIIGMFLCFVYEKSNNLLLCMGFHALNNLLLIPLAGQAVPGFMTNGYVDFALWAAVFIAIVYLMVRKPAAKQTETEAEPKRKRPHKKDTTPKQQRNQQRKQRRKKKK